MRRSRTASLASAAIFSVAVGFGIASAQDSSSSLETQRQPAPSARSGASHTQNAAQPTGEQDFVAQAALANMAEIQLGHLAVKNARHASVKAFAQRMIDDHVKVQKELADAAAGAGIQWPTQLDDRHRQLQKRLSTLGNEQFDREYMKAMVDGHRDVEKMLAARVSEGGGTKTRPSGAAKSEDSPLAARVNQWAAKTLPGVRAHLEEAEHVYGELEKTE